MVDANPMISAMSGGAAREVIFSGEFTLYSTQHTLFEVEKYIPAMARKLGRREIDLLREFELLPIIACQPSEYDTCLAEAERLISWRDPKDVQILALTLKLGYALWTEDRDFDGIDAISVRRTAEAHATPSLLSLTSPGFDASSLRDSSIITHHRKPPTGCREASCTCGAASAERPGELPSIMRRDAASTALPSCRCQFTIRGG